MVARVPWSPIQSPTSAGCKVVLLVQFCQTLAGGGQEGPNMCGRLHCWADPWSDGQYPCQVCPQTPEGGQLDGERQHPKQSAKTGSDTFLLSWPQLQQQQHDGLLQTTVIAPTAVTSSAASSDGHASCPLLLSPTVHLLMFDIYLEILLNAVEGAAMA